MHLALARGWIREERFEEAQTALAAVRTVDPNHADAASLARAIDDARRYAPQHAQSATRWIELEWFEPAFNALRQVIALQPDRRDALLDAYRAAAVGAGDDD